MRRIQGALVALLAAATACTDTVVVEPASGPNTAIVRFVNATGSALDFATDGQVARDNANLGYGRSSSCTTVGTIGGRHLTVYQPGTTTIVPGLDSSFDAGLRYTIVAYPSSAGPRFLTVRNGFTPAIGSAALNVVHVAGGASRYDVYVTAPGSSILGTASASALAHGSASSYFNVAGGAQQVQLTGAGSQAIALDAGALLFSPATSVSLVLAPPVQGSTTPRWFWVTGC